MQINSRKTFDFLDSKKRRQGKKRLSSGFVKLPSTPTQQNRTITSIIFADENQFLSTSNSSLRYSKSLW